MPVHVGRRGERQRKRRKIRREQETHLVLLLKNLLRRVQVAQEAAEHQSGGHRVADGAAISAHLACCSGQRPDGQRDPSFRRQRFRLPDREPDQHGRGERQQPTENRSPPGDQQDGLSQRRGDGGDNDEYRENERHDASHFTALVTVADQRQADDSRAGCADALQKSTGEHRRVAPRGHGQQAPQHEQPESNVHAGLPAETVRQRTVGDLPERKSQEQRGYHQLSVVFPHYAKIAADLGQGGQHGVNGQRRHGRQHRHHQDELARRKLPAQRIQPAERNNKATPMPAADHPGQVGAASSPSQSTPQIARALPAMTT